MVPVTLASIVLLAAFAYFAVGAIKAHIEGRLKSERQRELARVAPQLLTASDIPADVAWVIIRQGELLRDAKGIIHGTLHDENFVHGDAMDDWLKHYREAFPHES